MKIMADSVKRWLRRLERQEPEAYDELLGAIEAFEVAEDAFCQARDLLLQTMISVGFPERGTKGDGVRENVERIERYIKGKGYIRPKRPRGRRFDMRCPTGPSAMLAAAEPGTEMAMEFEEGELVANETPSYEAVDLRENVKRRRRPVEELGASVWERVSEGYPGHGPYPVVSRPPEPLRQAVDEQLRPGPEDKVDIYYEDGDWRVLVEWPDRTCEYAVDLTGAGIRLSVVTCGDV